VSVVCEATAGSESVGAAESVGSTVAEPAVGSTVAESVGSAVVALSVGINEVRIGIISVSGGKNPDPPEEGAGDALSAVVGATEEDAALVTTAELDALAAVDCESCPVEEDIILADDFEGATDDFGGATDAFGGATDGGATDTFGGATDAFGGATDAFGGATDAFGGARIDFGGAGAGFGGAGAGFGGVGSLGIAGALGALRGAEKTGAARAKAR